MNIFGRKGILKNPFISTLLSVGVILLVLTLTFSVVISKQNVPDYILLIDTSGSMQKVLQEELQGSRIIDYVKRVASNLAESCIKGTRVYVYTFDYGIKSEKEFIIESDQSRDSLVSYINNLQADGQATHIYKSLEYIAEKHAYTPENSNYALLYVFTDGVDNGGEGPESAIEYLQQNMTQRGYSVYYTTYGFETIDDAEKERLIEDIEKFQNAGVKLTNMPVVPNIQVVSPLEERLDFGNLQATPNPVQELTFYTLNPEELPDNFQINMEFEFSSLAGTNHVAYPEPESFALLETNHYTSQKIKFHISNPGSLRDEYKGILRLSDSDPMVIIAPDEIPVLFRYEPERTCTITTKWRDDEVNFGIINPYKESEAISKEYILKFDYNEAAVENGGNLLLRIELGEDNKTKFEEKVYFLFSGERTEEFLVTPVIAEVRIQVKGDEDAPAETFDFAIEGTSSDMTVTFVGAESINNGFTVSGEFEIVAKPWPWWIWALIILGLLFLVFIIVVGVIALLNGESPLEVLRPMFSVFAAVVIPDVTLVVKQPMSHAGQELNIKGKERVVIGKGGEFISEADQASIVFEPLKKGNKVLLMAKTVDGTAMLKATDESTAFPLISSEVYDGDKITIGDFEVEITSFHLIKV